jgi:hypothetical protein
MVRTSPTVFGLVFPLLLTPSGTDQQMLGPRSAAVDAMVVEASPIAGPEMKEATPEETAGGFVLGAAAEHPFLVMMLSFRRHSGWSLAKHAEGSGATSGVRAEHGRLLATDTVDALLGPSPIDFGEPEFSCEAHGADALTFTPRVYITDDYGLAAFMQPATCLVIGPSRDPGLLNLPYPPLQLD